MDNQHYTPDGKTVHCDKCGGDYVEGDFPFCKGRVEDHGRGDGFDAPFEPYVDIQLLPRTDPRCTDANELGIRGVPIRSRSDRRALMRELGLQFGTQKFEDRGKRKFFDMGKR